MKVRIAVGLTLCLGASAFAADQLKITQPVLDGKKVFLYDRCDGCTKDTKEVFASWGRYTLVDDVKQADLVFTFSGITKVDNGPVGVAGIGMTGGGGEGVRASSKVQLNIFDRAGHELYQETQNKSQDWEKPAAELVKSLRVRVDKADKKKR